MKDTKTSLLLVLSLLLLSLSLVLLCIWGYQYLNNDSSHAAYGSTTPGKLANSKTTVQFRDSLQKEFNSTIDNLNRGTIGSGRQQFNDTTQAIPAVQLNQKLQEIDQLKTDINNILKSRGNREDLDLAKQKINELQQKVDALSNRNRSIEEENKRLQALIAQSNSGNFSSKTTAGTNPAAPATSKSLIPTTTANAPTSMGNWTASELQFTGLSGKSEGNQETIFAEDAEKIVGSFNIRGNAPANGVAEVMIVIVQPDGKVLQGSPWETGSFQTATGKKIYSRKIKFDYDKNEARKLQFNVNAENLQRGQYSLQVFLNGQLIGQSTRVFS